MKSNSSNRIERRKVRKEIKEIVFELNDWLWDDSQRRSRLCYCLTHT